MAAPLPRTADPIERPPASRRAGLLAAGAAAGLLLGRAVHFWDPFLVVDDAFISFRYARNLAEGHGLVFNAGERVEGYTNFLWTLVLAAGACRDLESLLTRRGAP